MKSIKMRILSAVCAFSLAATVFTGSVSADPLKIGGLLGLPNKTMVDGKIVDESIEDIRVEGVFQNIYEDIDAQRIYDCIDELASEKYLGRLTGTEGNRLATEYIKSEFEKIGLEPMKGNESFLSPYTQKVYWMDESPVMKSYDKDGNIVDEMNFLEDFTTYAQYDVTINGETKGEVLILNDVEELKKEKENLKGKIVVISQDVRRNPLFGMAIMSKDNAPGAIILNGSGFFGENIKKKFVTMPQFDSPRGSYLYGIVNETGMEKLQEASDKGYQVEYAVGYNEEVKEVNNVVGVIPGTNEALKDEYIIISGHFDHLGENFNGEYNPGASDNASGTACLIEIARAMKENNIETARPIMFIAFNGEENGLLGSKAFVKDSGIDMSKVEMLNIDMVANKVDTPLYLGAVSETQLVRDIKEIAEEMGLSILMDLGKGYSDHASVESVGGEAVSFIELEQKEYHTPKDTIDIIDKEDLEDVVELVLRYVSRKI